jgi:5'-deoxynucleotidase YfbR-like HD superfamily hydrolase
MNNDGFDDFYENGHAPSFEEMQEQFRKRLYGDNLKNENKITKQNDLVMRDVITNDLAIQPISSQINSSEIRVNWNPGDRLEVQSANIQTVRTPDNIEMLDDKCSDGGWINTYLGKQFYPLNPRIEDIDIEDIAHALSRINRFTGHINKENYSVAEHSVLVSYFCNEEDRKHALLHDGSEFALADLSSPLKRSGKFENYKKFEKQLQSMIYKKFGLNEEEPKSVRNADLLMLATEAVNLFDNINLNWNLPCAPAPITIKGLNPNAAKKLFMDRFKELFK